MRKQPSVGSARLARFTPAERRLIARLRTPDRVQAYLNRLPYNREAWGETFRSLRQVLRHRTAHCSEAALLAACILEQHGYPPLVMSLESADLLDHVIFVYRKRGRWGSVARSRDPGLHGRKPVFGSLRALAMSYFDPYIDPTGCITGYALVDLARFAAYDWRVSPRNMWAVQEFLVQARHTGLKPKPSRRRVRRMRARYRAYIETHSRKPLFYWGREKWTAIPAEFL